MSFVFEFDLNGNPMARLNKYGEPYRTKWTHPYNYDPILQYDNGQQASDTVYSDRLAQWDREKFDRLFKKHLDGKGWLNGSPKAMEAFLCEYLDKPVTLCRVEEHCNQATGYPLWRLDFKEKS